MKALIATDGSASSFEAIHQACRILSPERDEIVLYYSPPDRQAAELDSTTIARGQHALSDAIFDAAIKEFSEAWRGKVQRIFGNDDPRADIVAAAAKINAGLVAVGARGVGAVTRLLLGSVSRSVVHSAKVPVLVARTTEAKQGGRGLRVLLACENAENGKQLAQVVSQFAWPPESNCEVLTVVPSVLGSDVPGWLASPQRSPEVQQLIAAWVEEEQAQLNAARSEMEAIGKSLPEAFHSWTVTVAQGQVAAEVVEAARKHHSDLIVLGKKAQSAIGRFFVGSTCEAVLNRAPCSVLVVPAQ
jgi:nucleotide-binding universal stress UspA family protein